jgi:molybdopterin/thiamine biosynthesis adenylyltransferase
MSNRQFLHEEIYRGKEFTTLKDKVVVMAGCGAVGSWCANFLARMGVHNFRLIDMDRVEEHNVSTQSFTPANVGQYKTRALQEQLYRIRKARCELQPVELTYKNAPTLLSSCDVVICSFDNRTGRNLVKDTWLRQNYVKPKTSVAYLFAGMNGQETYFEVVWAENYKVPADPEQAALDPCAYPMSTPLVVSTAATAAEIAVQYLLTGQKKECRQSLNQQIS